MSKIISECTKMYENVYSFIFTTFESVNIEKFFGMISGTIEIVQDIAPPIFYIFFYCLVTMGYCLYLIHLVNSADYTYNPYRQGARIRSLDDLDPDNDVLLWKLFNQAKQGPIRATYLSKQ